jgi:hypothetical protein
MSHILSIARTVLTPFTKQKNTGNCYEIYTALYFLRCMGLTNTDYDQLAPIIRDIAQTNNKSASKITTIFVNIREKPIATSNIVNIRNVTQDDGDGGTGDLILVMADGTEKSVSVCEGKRKKNGDIEKCLSNPTCKRFGCNSRFIK